MTQNNYEKLLAKGNKILEQYMPELNKISNEHIKRTNQNYRREEDVNEIAIALALYDDRIESLLV